MTTSGKALEGVIYTFEARSKVTSLELTPFLLVKGSWNGEADSWYRIDFFGKLNSTATENVYLPLLRNYRYTVSIDGVSGRGYGSPDEAANASFTNIQATTHTLNEGNIERVVWDGYNYLAVTTNTYEIGNSNVVQNIGHISATTNYSTGWTATVKIATGDQAGWLTLTNTSGAGDENAQPLGMSVQPNTGTGNRTAVVTVTAGRLKQTVTVTQLLNQKLSLDIGNVEAVFPAKTTPAMFSLPIEWEPAGTPVQIEIIHAGTPAAAAYATEYNDNRLNGYSNGLIFSGDNVISATLVDTDGNPSNGGTALLSICPDKDENLDTFAERRTILKITSNNGATPVAHTEVKTVLLRQLDYEIVLEGERETYQPNTTYSIIVKSNAPWEVAATGPNAGEINILSAFYGEPNTEGVTLTFKTGGTDNAEPKLTFTPVGGAQKEVGVLLKQMLPNCYIVAPGTTNFTFPIAKVWEVWSTDRDLVGEYPAALEGTLSANLLWQDVQGLIISQPTLNGADRDATISLSTASLSGNAVVELKVDGVTRWSWHIWVCDFDPDENTGYNAYNGLIIMERNLGAMNNTPGDAGSFGLLYQWGRKDPFLSSGSATPPITAKPVYEFGGATVDMTAEATSQIMNLIETISYPFRFYTGQLWYTNDNTSLEFHRMDFWDSSIVGKTIFDPCPEGWKTPIENMMMYVNPASYVIGEGLYAGTIGFFPSVPYRNAGDATLITVIPQNSYYHSGLSFFTGGLSGYGNSHNISPTRVALSPIGPAMGIPARCVKIQ
jgi:hypothetical protein